MSTSLPLDPSERWTARYPEELLQARRDQVQVDLLHAIYELTDQLKVAKPSKKSKSRAEAVKEFARRTGGDTND